MPASSPTISLALRSRNDPLWVQRWQSILNATGFYVGKQDGDFGPRTDAQTRQFQMGRIGPDGRFLDVDGVVGPATWWAGFNPSGTAQRSFIMGDVPAGVTGPRLQLLQWMLAEHARGVREIPDGSNDSPRIRIYLNGMEPAAWCAAFASCGVKSVNGAGPFGTYFWLVAALVRAAKRNSAWIPNTPEGRKQLQPGDLFAMLYKDGNGEFTGTGHTGGVLRVDDHRFNTIEGNAGNRVKQGLRSYSQSALEGFIRVFPVLTGEFDRRTLDAPDVNSLATR